MERTKRVILICLIAIIPLGLIAQDPKPVDRGAAPKKNTNSTTSTPPKTIKDELRGKRISNSSSDSKNTRSQSLKGSAK
jgi:hypothetical protein